MKHIWLSVAIVTGSLFMSTQTLAQKNSAEALLQDMNKASTSLNYELSFISMSPQGITPLRYRHILIDGKPIAQIMQMDASRREIVQKDNEISYFEPGLDSFSLRGPHIVDYLPPVVFADFDKLNKYYHFIDVGRTHIGDRPSNVIRITSKDNSRYNYIVVIDDETKLPLQIELLDINNISLEQFRVVSSSVNNTDVIQALSAINKLKMPPLLAIPKSEKVTFGWDVMRLPNGFNEVTRNRRQMSENDWLETIMYSDGLFSFSVNVAKSAGQPTVQQPIRQGARTYFTTVKGDNEITVFGELPIATAQQIAEGVTFNDK